MRGVRQLGGTGCGASAQREGRAEGKARGCPTAGASGERADGAGAKGHGGILGSGADGPTVRMTGSSRVDPPQPARYASSGARPAPAGTKR
jgi:hypothetical protein